MLPSRQSFFPCLVEMALFLSLGYWSQFRADELTGLRAIPPRLQYWRQYDGDYH